MQEQGKTRYSIDIDVDHRERLAALAKEFKITQGEVIEVLLDTMAHAALSPHFTAKREEKVARRAPKKDLYKKLKELSPAQLEAALKAAEQVKE